MRTEKENNREFPTGEALIVESSSTMKLLHGEEFNVFIDVACGRLMCCYGTLKIEQKRSRFSRFSENFLRLKLALTVEVPHANVFTRH